MDAFCAVLAKKKLLSEEGARIVRRILKTLTKLLLDYMEREERRKREREKINMDCKKQNEWLKNTNMQIVHFLFLYH